MSQFGLLTALRLAKYSSRGMLKRGLSLAAIIVLLGGAVGASADDGSWVERNMPLCCKKARSTAHAPEVSMARLCCKLNCSEPGSGGSSNASSLSRNQATNSPTAIIPTPAQFSRFAIRNHYPQANHSHELQSQVHSASRTPDLVIRAEVCLQVDTNEYSCALACSKTRTCTDS